MIAREYPEHGGSTLKPGAIVVCTEVILPRRRGPSVRAYRHDSLCNRSGLAGDRDAFYVEELSKMWGGRVRD